MKIRINTKRKKAWMNPVMGLFCLLLCLPLSSAAQRYEKNNYSSKKRFPVNNSDSISIYLDSAQNLATRAPMKAINFVNRAIELSVVENDSRNEALAYLALGNIQQSLDQHVLAIENYKHCLRALSPAKEGYADKKEEYSKSKISISSLDDLNSTRFNAYAQLAVSQLALNDLVAAEENIRMALSLAADGITAADLRDAQRIKASVLIYTGREREAVELLNELIGLERQAGNAENETETLLALGDAFLMSGDDGRAIEFYNTAKKLADQNGFTEYAVQANTSLAGFYRAQGKYQEEIDVRNDNITLNKVLNNSLAVSQENFEIGNAYINANNVEKAEGYLREGLKNIPTAEALVRMNSTADASSDVMPTVQYRSAQFQQGADAFKRLAEGFLKLNDLRKAVEYYTTYSRLQDSVEIARKAELEQAIALSSGIGKNQQRIELLEKERLLNDRSIEILRRDQALKSEQLVNRNMIIGSLVGCILLLGIAGFFVIRNTLARRKADKLLALQSLSGQMNPHFIFNALNSVNEYIARNDERSANRYLSSFSRLMRRVMDDSRHTFITLKEELEMLELYLQLEHARFRDQFDYYIDADAELRESDILVPPMIIQPYLENAIWHGLRYRDGKGDLKLGFKMEGQALVITISDNGVGVQRSKELKTQNQKKQSSLGMQNIRTRVQLMNELYHAGIIIAISENEPGSDHPGTVVRIEIPRGKYLDQA